MNKIFQIIANELSVKVSQVEATVGLLDGGDTVPFIARYRKEVTEALDDIQLRNLEERLRYLRELEERREAILKSIKEQDKLTPALEKDIVAADTKTRLEDLYLPYKPKRRTKAQIAREAGLEPLATELFANPELNPETEAEKYIIADEKSEHKVPDIKAALDGAKQILMEQFSEDAELLSSVRHFLWNDGQLSVRVVAGKEKEGAKFRDYFTHDELIKKVPSHRALAILRGRKEGFLQFSLVIDPEAETTAAHPCEAMIADHLNLQYNDRAADKWLKEVVRWTWRVKLLTYLESELVGNVRDAAEQEAINVFAANLKDLLLAAPAGQRCTLGLDPGLRTGVKVVVVDNTGKLIDNTTIFPHAPRKQWDQSIAILAKLCEKHKVDLVAIGNGTASRETDKLTAELMKKHSELKLTKIITSEAGASIYSASELASKEFPDLDVTFRGAVSIARRLQDPLAELVKIEPKAIGVGQYQHDVSQTKLARSLDAVVEDCVNSVGIDVNMASAPLLTRVAGLNITMANNIVDYRDQNGAFKNRKELLKVARLGEKAFEQCAGFLRITQGDNPLDNSSVHPEAYPVVNNIAASNTKDITALMGNSSFLRALNAADYTDEKFGLPTITDIISELEKPGRDPRPEFKAAEFKDGVETLADLKENMLLEGVITNVTNFGAFVDIGVHQDGLVHISVLADKFVKDPREVVKAGDIVKVKVVEVDIPRKRIALTMRLSEPVQASGEKTAPSAHKPAKNRTNKPQAKKPSNRPQQKNTGGTFADLFKDAKKNKNSRL